MGRKTHNASVEIGLVKDKASLMTNGQLADEIQRCIRGIQMGQSASAIIRFERRKKIMEEECDRRIAAAGGAR